MNIHTGRDGRVVLRGSVVTRVLAVLLAGASLAAAGWSMAWQLEEAQLLTARSASQLQRIPQDIMPAGVSGPPAQPALTTTERHALDRSLWRDPLQPKLVNLLYTEAIRRDLPSGDARRLAALLARLGWRYTPAQQNLVINAILAGRFAEVVDRADGLLRRQKMAAFSYAILATMEAIPQVQGNVLGKLVGHPSWRRDYLSVIGPQSGAALLEARARTIAALLRSPAGLSREEMAPSLIALVASGRGRIAHDLWMRRAGERDSGNLVYDPDFQQAAAFAGTSSLDIPFEWRLAQDAGHAAQASSDGITIDWDRRGVPVLLSQTVAVTPSQRYVLILRGQANGTGLETLLTPTLVCGQASIGFAPFGDTRQGEARYRSESLPDGCDLATLTISGGLDTGSGGVTIQVTQVILKRDS